MADNPYGYAAGNCTWWVDHLAPWVDSYGNFGDAHNWLPHAQQSGLATSTTPHPGDIAVWKSSAPGSGGYGHVALVTGVQGNGLPIVSEMNYSGLGHVDTRNVDATSASYLAGYIRPPSEALGQSALSSATAQGSAAPTLGYATSAETGSGWSVGPFQVLSGSGVHRLLYTLTGLGLTVVGIWILFRREIASGIAAIPKPI